MNMLPLYVDLDGTLLATDTLWESFAYSLKNSPVQLLYLPVWLCRGKAAFKAALSSLVVLPVDTLPYRQDVLHVIRERRAAGGTVILATAAHERVAKDVAGYLGCFDDVIATTERRNVSGSMKAEAIAEHAQGPFGYMGNDRADVAVWRCAEERLVVASSQRKVSHLAKAVGQSFHRIFSDSKPSVGSLLFQTLRLHQWAKNILLFVPFLLAHRFTDGEVWIHAWAAFFAFSFTASGTYIFNDLFDLEADRRHAIKHLRPIASGYLTISSALIIAFSCLVFSFFLAWIFLPASFPAILLGYIVLTFTYSFRLKRLPIIDLLLLAFFYVYRLVAGAVVTEVFLTPWLLAFAAFLFVSLGCLKRVSEMIIWQQLDNKISLLNGRGYDLEDLSLMKIFGVNAGFLSTLVLALYVNSQEVVSLYRSPFLLWGVVCILLYWLMRIWLLASRGMVHEDPVLFALRDGTSRVVALLIFLCVILAI